MSKTDYSLFGNRDLGYKRFLYDAYLPAEHPDQGIRFTLTPDMQRLLYNKVKQIEQKIGAKLKKSLNDRIWPVDRWVILLFAHCYVNAMERVGCLLKEVLPGGLRFNARDGHTPSNPPLTVSEYLSRLSSSKIYEQILSALFAHYKVEVRYEPLKVEISAKESIGSSALYSYLKPKLKPIWTNYFYRKDLAKHIKMHNVKKPLLFVLNNLLDSDDINACHEVAASFNMSSWSRYIESSLPENMITIKKHADNENPRKLFERNLGNIFLETEAPLFKKVIPVLIKNYPVSLMEGRHYLIAQSQKFLRRIVNSEVNRKKALMTTDHRIWKNEIFSAVAAEFMKDNGFVASTAHGSPDGFLEYATSHTVDQCLITHYLANFKEPFVHIEEESPKVFQTKLLKKFYSIGKNRDEDNSFSIWYFPHWQVTDPAFKFMFHAVEHPEGYFENQKNVLYGLNMIASHHKVREVVIKFRTDIGDAQLQRYLSLMEQVFGKEDTSRFRIVTDIALAQAFPDVSIAVHDMFSSSFIESMWANIPTIAVLPGEQEVPLKLIDREYWIKSGVFVRNSSDLFNSLLGWLEGKVPDDYEKMKERFLIFCGLGSPTGGEALKSILKSLA